MRARNAAQAEANRLERQANALLEERARLEAEVGQIANRNSREYERATRRQIQLDERLNAIQADRADALRRTQSILGHGFRDAAHSAGQSIQQGLGQAADAVFQQVAAAARRAQQALVQTHRHALPDIADYGRVSADYVAMIDEAGMTALRYGFSIEEVTETQHRFIQAMNIDVAAGNFSTRVADMANTMAFIAARTGQSIQEVEAFSEAALSTFGRGGEAQVEAYGRTMRALTQIPSMMAEELQNAGQEVGNLFSNQRTFLMIQEWTQQFGDQAANIGEMAAAMAIFERNAAKAGHSTRAITTMTNALVSGIQGQQEDTAITVRAGQELQRRIREDPEFLTRLRESHRQATGQDMSDTDIALMQRLAAPGANALAASDLFQLLKGTGAGMSAYMGATVGTNTGDISITRRMLSANGIDADPATQLRIAEMMERAGPGGIIDEAEIARVMAEAQSRGAAQSDPQEESYRNIGIARVAAERSAELLASLDGTTKAILLGVGVIAENVYNELEDAEVSRNVVTNATDASQVRRNLQSWRDTSGDLWTHEFDIDEAGDRAALVQQLAAARSSLDEAEYETVRRHLTTDLDIGREDLEGIDREVEGAQFRMERERVAAEDRRRREAAAAGGDAREGADAAIRATTPPTTPVTPPTAATAPPAAAPAVAPGAPGSGFLPAMANTVGTPGNPLAPVRPGTMAVQPDGSGTIRLEFAIADFAPAVERANLVNIQNAPTGLGR